MSAYVDTNAQPAERVGESCLNCGNGYSLHTGWSCRRPAHYTMFSDLLMVERYLTRDMLNNTLVGSIASRYAAYGHNAFPSLLTCANCGKAWGLHQGMKCPTRVGSFNWSEVPPAPPAASQRPTQATEPSDWKVWRDICNQGNCPCGIPLTQHCRFHP